ncbi:hypothetical protein NSE_0239 [Neorickettsia sennetsu str. Miyayama]|uniref:Uncharacterized protein n=1 Tax=Ehrlichia sennetsu (strain ATCC VR-367 / Miyayama) TaxID=222891 RepID=Q2GEG3_EHRS3|nr:hypothetical protein NSE_0239 [Neorickettsia sennetsu str. Miyayama]
MQKIDKCDHPTQNSDLSKKEDAQYYLPTYNMENI